MSYYNDNPLADGKPLVIQARRVEDTTAYAESQRNCDSAGASAASKPGFHQVCDMKSLQNAINNHILPYGAEMTGFFRETSATLPGIHVNVDVSQVEFGVRKLIDKLIEFNDTWAEISVRPQPEQEGQVLITFPLFPENEEGELLMNPFPKCVHLQTKEELQQTIYDWKRRYEFLSEYGKKPRW